MDVRSLYLSRSIAHESISFDNEFINKIYWVSPSCQRVMGESGIKETTQPPCSFEMAIPEFQGMLGMPDAAVDLQFAWGKHSSLPDVFITGSFTKGRLSRLSDYDYSIGVKLFPGLNRTFQDFDMASLFGKRANAKDVFGARFVSDVVFDVETPGCDLESWANGLKEMVNTRFVEEYCAPVDGVVAFLVSRILETCGTIKIDDLVEEAGCSHRYACVLFKQSIGCTIKRFAEIIRLQQAIAMLTCSSSKALVDISGSCGFYDQAHFTRQFSEFASMTPRRFRSDAEKMTLL